MCGKSLMKTFGPGSLLGGLLPSSFQDKPAQVDPQAAQEKVDAQAAQNANARLAKRRKSLAEQSLAVGGDMMSTGVPATGKATFGG